MKNNSFILITIIAFTFLSCKNKQSNIDTDPINKISPDVLELAEQEKNRQKELIKSLNIPLEVLELAEKEFNKQKEMTKSHEDYPLKFDTENTTLGVPIQQFTMDGETFVNYEKLREKIDAPSLITAEFKSYDETWVCPLVSKDEAIVKEITIVKRKGKWQQAGFGDSMLEYHRRVQNRYPEKEGYKTIYFEILYYHFSIVIKDDKVLISPLKRNPVFGPFIPEEGKEYIYEIDYYMKHLIKQVKKMAKHI